MQLPHFFQVGHHRKIDRLLIVLVTFLAPTVVVAEEPAPLKVVALDQTTGDLLRACFPTMNFEVLVRFESESNTTVNRRAWSTRDADVLVFRSAQISIRSRLFRERLMTQGIRVVDLDAHISINRALKLRLETVGPNFLRSDLEQMATTHVPVMSNRVASELTSKPLSVFDSRDPCLEDDNSPCVRCPPHGINAESEDRAMAKVYTRQGNE